MLRAKKAGHLEKLKQSQNVMHNTFIHFILHTLCNFKHQQANRRSIVIFTRHEDAACRYKSIGAQPSFKAEVAYIRKVFCFGSFLKKVFQKRVKNMQK